MLKLNFTEEFISHTPSRSLSSLSRMDCLGALAIGGYVLFLPWDSHPDLSTLLLLTLGLFAVSNWAGRWSRLNQIDGFLIAAIIISATVSATLSDEPARSFRYVVYVGFNVFLLVLAAGIKSSVAMRILTGSLGLVGVLHLASLLISFQSGMPGTASSLVRQAYMNTMIVPNDAMILGLCLPSLVFILRGESPGRTIFLYASTGLYLGLSIYVSYRLQSKISLLSLLSAVLILVASHFYRPAIETVRKRRLPTLITLFGILAILSASAWYFGNHSTTRLSLWIAAGSAHDNVSEVFFGAGPNTFLYDPATVESSFDKGDAVIPWVHNLFLEAYYEQGLLGFLIIIAVTLIPILRSLNVMDPSVRSLLMASTFTIFLLAIFEITLTRRFYFAYLAIVYGLAVAHTTRTET